MIYGRKVEYKNPLFGQAHILLNDEMKYPIGEVRYFQDDKGFYLKNTLNEFSNTEFLEREVSGRVSLFTKWSFSGGYYNVGTGGFVGGGAQKKQFYTKDGFTNIKKYKLDNLQIDLGDKVSSMNYLNQAREAQTVKAALMVTGLVLLFTGPIIIASSKNVSTGFPVMGVGAVCLLGSWIPHFIQSDKTKKAIIDYNKQ